MPEKKTAKTATISPRKSAAAASPSKSAAPRAAASKPAGARTAASKAVASRGRKVDAHESVQRRAYELWESEGRPAGREHDHWLQAERELGRSAARASA